MVTSTQPRELVIPTDPMDPIHQLTASEYLAEAFHTVQAAVVTNRCRLCNAAINGSFTLGPICLNGFPAPDEPDPEPVPLKLGACVRCGLVQLWHTVRPELMFTEYWYRSSTNEAMRQHLEALARMLQNQYLRPGDVVLDVGCNDGYFLSQFNQMPIMRVGYDPAENLELIPGAVDDFIPDYFDKSAYLGRRPKVITTLAMFYDLSDPLGVASDLMDLLRDDGVWIAEFHYLPTMLKDVTFDAICHEHLTYWSLSAFKYLTDELGAVILDAELNGTNGGSIRVTVAKSGDSHPRVQRLLEAEADHLEDFAVYQEVVDNARDVLIHQLDTWRSAGKRVLGYGASTKGNTLLQFAKIGPDIISAIADRQTFKHGRVTPGTRIPIISEAEMRRQRPDFLLALPYHFIESFTHREAGLLKQGTRFIVPVPEVRLVP